MKRLLGKLALVLATVAYGLGISPAFAADGTASAKGKYQIVFQVSENNPQQWQLALNNAMAFQRNVGKENTQIEIVANGPGLNMLKNESQAADRISQALDKGIDVVACGETMTVTKVSKVDLVGGVRVVPGGIIEIADRQRAGWVYIHP